MIYGKTCLRQPLKKNTKIAFQDQFSLNASQTYCRMLQGELSVTLLTFIKLPLSIKTMFCLFLSGPLKTGYTVRDRDISWSHLLIHFASVCCLNVIVVVRCIPFGAICWRLSLTKAFPGPELIKLFFFHA